MPNSHVMIDLESLDTKPSAVILSLGAVVFNSLSPTEKTFYQRISPEQEDLGRTKSDATIKWWEKQAPEAQEEAFSGTEDLTIVLLRFRQWLEKLPYKPVVWSNGATFDISILEHAYNYQAPWKFWNIRDTRTIVGLTKGFVDKKQFEFTGTKHNALDDAIYQARYVSAMYKTIREALTKNATMK